MSTTGPGSYIEENMQPHIQILGAGIAGLSLACHLRLRQIPFKIFDAASKPKGHNYGITILPEAYKNLLPALEAKPDISSFVKLTAVDRLVEGRGIVSASDHHTTQSNDRRIRVSDSSLRDLLSRNHNIKWNHNLTSTISTPKGLQLTFSNGETSTATITVDVAGERSHLTSLLLPDLKPTILPYAVYHGSRYLTLQTFQSEYPDLFPSNSNVSEYTHAYTPPYPSSPKTKLYIQLSKSYINHASLPSSLKSQFPPSSSLIELRYTLSRPSLSLPHLKQDSTNTDPLFNPSRSTSEAKTIPGDLFTELSSFLSQNSQSVPQSLNSLLSPSTIQNEKDRILNWLLRLKIPSSQDLKVLAEKGVLVIGDAAHSLPILGSEGASLAMEDGRILAEWLDGKVKSKETKMMEKDLVDFYTTVRESWEGAEKRSRRWLREVHCQEEDREGEGDSKL